VAVEDAEDQLAWEARQRKPAAAAAAVAAVGIFVGTLWRGLILDDRPTSGILESLSRAEQPGPIGGLPSLRIPALEFYDERATTVLLSSVVTGIGYLALGWALTYLAVAVRARRAEFPRFVVYLPLIGGILQAITTIVAAFGTDAAIRTFLDGPRTVDAANDITASGLTVFATILGLPGALALALGLVFVGLNAMRTGLLTRFMGVLAIITGVLQILPFGGPLPVVQSFWLLMLAVLFAGQWPGGVPPAWRTGKAEPWPSSAQIREQRAKAAAERRGETHEPEPDREPVTAGPSPSASARKRKRKRR
jgi:membrane protein implicated in regulation of membrane protease activity